MCLKMLLFSPFEDVSSLKTSVCYLSGIGYNPRMLMVMTDGTKKLENGLHVVITLAHSSEGQKVLSPFHLENYTENYNLFTQWSLKCSFMQNDMSGTAHALHKEGSRLNLWHI